MAKFNLKTGKVIGFEHLHLGANCQDSLEYEEFELDDKEYKIVFISDGSTVAEEKSVLIHSEVGANLTSKFLVKKTEKYLRDKVHQDLIPYFLFSDLLEYYQAIIDLQQLKDEREKINFIKYNLLCTVLGLIITPRQGIIIRYGDGLVVLDDQVQTFDYDDQPPYVAYNLIPNSLKINPRSLPSMFDVTNFDPDLVSKVAIGSDAFSKNLDLVPLFWNHQHPNQIQRNLNIWSKVEHKLYDDASLAVAERKE